MKIREIRYDDEFENEFLSLPKTIQSKACKTERLLRTNPFHPSLRLHKLKGNLLGAWSVSVDRKHRIIFKPLDNGVILFASIGTHAIYDSV